MSFSWTLPPSRAWQINRYMDLLERGILAAWSVLATQIEDYGKQNAAWTDRTGNARQTLKGFAYSPRSRLIVLIFKQQMTYGLWLEIAHQGRYAIVMRSLEMHYGDAMRSVQAVVS